jgi:hypothetical protein
MVRLTAPAFSSSIFTADPTFPDDVQVIAGVVPEIQVSPPLGAVTVIEGAEERADTVPGNSIINTTNPTSKKIFRVFVIYCITSYAVFHQYKFKNLWRIDNLTRKVS